MGLVRPFRLTVSVGAARHLRAVVEVAALVAGFHLIPDCGEAAPFSEARNHPFVRVSAYRWILASTPPGARRGTGCLFPGRLGSAQQLLTEPFMLFLEERDLGMKKQYSLPCDICSITFMVCRNCYEFTVLGPAFAVCLDCVSPEKAQLLKQGKQPCALFPVDIPYFYCWCVGEEKPDSAWPFNIRGPYRCLVSDSNWPDLEPPNYDYPNLNIWPKLMEHHSFPNIETIRAKWGPG